MLFVSGGQFCYKDADHDGIIVQVGEYLSEPVLWSQWHHCGELASVDTSCLLDVNAEVFGNVIAQHMSACVIMTRYAQHFLYHLNQATLLTDLNHFEISLGDLRNNLFYTAEEDHFLFISHFKEEAGTEATLMWDGLEALINADPGLTGHEYQHPVFIDSEDLDDLSRLLEPVKGSVCVVLLLTPRVLSRPWCLIELVTAANYGVRIVPVEVQRPGIQYAYPDAAFYQKLLDGSVIAKGGQALLERHHISLEQVVDVLEQVFLKIALPFSPHKSGNVRQAELMDIIRRAQNRSSMAFSESTSFTPESGKPSRVSKVNFMLEPDLSW